MPQQSVEDILNSAKQTLKESNEKFPPLNPQPAPTPSKPSYSQAHQARKTPSLADELKAKGEMVQKAKEALK